MNWRTIFLILILTLSVLSFAYPVSAKSNQGSTHGFAAIARNPLLSSSAMLYFEYKNSSVPDRLGAIGRNFQPPASNLPATTTSNPDSPSSLPNLTPAGSIRFIIDQSYMPQSETSVAVDPQSVNRVVGGFNDARFFFCGLLSSSACPSGYTLSLSGFSVSLNSGQSVAKSSDIPAMTVTEFDATSQQSFTGLLVPWGDPSVVAGPNGKFYYASLAIDPNTGANGIMVAVSNNNLFSSSISCVTQLSNPTSNQCWTTAFVYGNLTVQCYDGFCYNTSFEDKDLATVDMNPSSPYFGSLYIAWDHFYSDGTSSAYVARCNQALQCTMLSGGNSPVVSGSDEFVAFTTPSVGKDGTVYVSWCNYGTFISLGPVSCKIVSSPPGGNSFGPPNNILSFMGSGTTYPSYSVTIGFATEQFRTDSIPYMVADPTNANNIYFTISVCTQGSYYNFPFFSTDNPGNCGLSSVIFARSTDKGATWSSRIVSSPAVNTQPSITVDPSNGVVVLTYYTTQFDPFNHRIDVVALVSYNHGNNFGMRRVTGTSNEPNSDPSDYDYFSGFGGSFIVPQYGDYFQAAAVRGKIYVLYTANYVPEQGTYQTDPFLAVVTETGSLIVTGSDSFGGSSNTQLGSGLIATPPTQQAVGGSIPSALMSFAQKAILEPLGSLFSQFFSTAELAIGALASWAVVLVLLAYTALRVRKK